MVRIETELVIAAPPKRVWSVLADLARWGEWNPLMPEARGTLELGGKLAVVAHGPDGKRLRFTARVVEFEPGRALAWKGGVPGVLLGRHYFRLASHEGGGTRLTHGEEWSGLYPRLKAARLEALRPGYEALNRALAERVAQLET